MLSCKERIHFSDMNYSLFQSKNVFVMDNTLYSELHTVHSWLINTESEEAAKSGAWHFHLGFL